MHVKVKGRTSVSHWWETTATGKDVAELFSFNHMIRLIKYAAVVMTTVVRGAVFWVSGSFEVLAKV